MDRSSTLVEAEQLPVRERVGGPNFQSIPDYRWLDEEGDSRFHDCIKENDWVTLKKLLKRYRADYFKKKRIQAREKEKAIEEWKSFSKKIFVDPADIVSPLLLIDSAGMTPAHLACTHKAPEKLILGIVEAEKNAFAMKDHLGRLPLHCAIETWQYDHVLERIVKANPRLMKRRKIVLPSEHGLILDALEAGANPNTINRFISCSDEYLKMDDELGGTAIGLCVERHYTVDTLEYLLETCRDGTTIITDVVQKALKTHYSMGCYPLREGMVPFGKRVIDWSKKLEREKKRRKKEKKKKETLLSKQRSVRFKDEVDGEDDEIEKKKENWDGMKKTCKDWWKVLNHLIFYIAYGRNFKAEVQPKIFHLLHAALCVPIATPSLIHLLLIVYPEAIDEKCPMYNVLPVHIACTRWRYNIVYSDIDNSSMEQVLRLMYESDPGQLYRRHKGSLPIHMALMGGQIWSFVKPQTSMDVKLVGMRDVQSKLFPFQIAALPIPVRSIQLLMRFRFSPAEWRGMAFVEKKMEHDKVTIEQEVRQLTTIYELLRIYPDAVANKPVHKQSSLISRSLRSLSDLAKHYLSWVYGRNSLGEYRVHYDNLTALRNSIMEAEILPELQEWWHRLKECIWNDSHVPVDVPKENEYLLHAALYNSETPPIVTELLIRLFPSSTARPIPGSSTFPLHIAADTSAYQRKEFELPYGSENLHLVLKSYKEATRLKSNGRLPLHISLARGKSWKEVLPLVTVNPSSLKVRDMQTGLLPFELLASFKLTARENSLWFSNFLEKQMDIIFDLHQLSTQDRANALGAALKKKELSQLTCIFELIRRVPSVLSIRQSGFKNVNDDDSVHSLYSFGEDEYDLEEDSALFEITLDTDSEAGRSRELLSLDGSNVRSMPSVSSVDDAPRLDSLIDGSENTSSSEHLEGTQTSLQLEEESEVDKKEPESSEQKHLTIRRVEPKEEVPARQPIRKIQRKWMTLE
eukprot:jgi/Psemu1/264685/estExt_Genewise1Plus.C_21340001